MCYTETARNRFRHARRILRMGPWLLGVLVGTTLSAGQPSAQIRSTEEDVKSAYLFNFGKFIRSAAENRSPTFDICLLGRDDLQSSLNKITHGESIDGRPIRVVRIEPGGDARSCAIVYFSPSEEGRLDKDLTALHGVDALTVSDLPEFLAHGGMIQFLPQGDRIRFSVNLDAVGHTKLQLSSELLRVAASVKGAPNGEVHP